MLRKKLTFPITSAANDQNAYKYSTGYPVSGSVSRDSGWLQARRTAYGTGDYDVYTPLVKFDTSAIPDDARIISAELELYCEEVSQTNGAIANGFDYYGQYDNGWSLYADWRVFDNTDLDWTDTASKTANSGVHMTFFQSGKTARIHLKNASANVSKMGMTGVRLVLGDGVTPTGDNHLAFAAYEHEASNVIERAARLLVEVELPTKKKGFGQPASISAPRSAWGIHRPWHEGSYSGAYLDATINRCGGSVPKWFSVFFDWGTAYPPTNDQDLLPLRTELRARGIGMAHCEVPSNSAAGNTQSNYQLADINAGTFDTYLAARATRFAAYADPVIFRILHEMNSHYTSHALRANGNTIAQFVSAWQRIHGIFQANGATNCKFTWNVIPLDNYDSRFTMRPQEYYPGDAYVDYVSVDGYNFGTLISEGWKTPEQVFRKTYDALRALTRKPVLISEFSSVESGGSKAQWNTDFYTGLADKFPQVVGHHIYDEEFGLSGQELLDSSSTALNAFQAEIKKPEHQARSLYGTPSLYTWDSSLVTFDSSTVTFAE